MSSGFYVVWFLGYGSSGYTTITEARNKALPFQKNKNTAQNERYMSSIKVSASSCMCGSLSPALLSGDVYFLAGQTGLAKLARVRSIKRWRWYPVCWRWYRAGGHWRRPMPRWGENRCYLAGAASRRGRLAL